MVDKLESVPAQTGPEMDAIKTAKGPSSVHVEMSTSSNPREPTPAASGASEAMGGSGRPVYRVYKRRFFGLAQLVLLNTVVSWDVCEIDKRRMVIREKEGEGANIH